jgi:hypothetical protein
MLFRYSLPKFIKIIWLRRKWIQEKLEVKSGADMVGL